MSFSLILFLTIYLVGVILCVFMIWRQHRKHKGRMSLVELFLIIYLAMLSWVGVLSLVAGALTSFNMIEWNEGGEDGV